jgi:hypothetical protein
MDFTAIKTETARKLQVFLTQEVADVESKKRSSCINCRVIEIENLAKSLDVSIADLPGGWQELCQEGRK